MEGGHWTFKKEVTVLKKVNCIGSPEEIKCMMHVPVGAQKPAHPDSFPTQFSRKVSRWWIRGAEVMEGGHWTFKKEVTVLKKVKKCYLQTISLCSRKTGDACWLGTDDTGDVEEHF